MFYLIVGKKNNNKKREKKHNCDQDLNQGPQHLWSDEVSKQEQGQEQDSQESNI